MSPAYTTPEQLERWHKRTCARCARQRWFAARWPDGHVCRTCHDQALRVRGHCPGCGANRALPGRRDLDNAAICSDCAGFTMSYRCSRCCAGRQAARWTTAPSTTGSAISSTTVRARVRPELAPPAKLFLGVDSPGSPPTTAPCIPATRPPSTPGTPNTMSAIAAACAGFSSGALPANSPDRCGCRPPRRPVGPLRCRNTSAWSCSAGS